MSLTPSSNGHVLPETLSPFDDIDLAVDMADLDLDQLRAEAIRQGIDLSQPRVQQAIAGRRAKARDLALASAPNQPSKYFIMLRDGIMFIGNGLLLALMLLLSYALLPVAIVGLFYAEVQRVSLGVALFDPPRAILMATVSVSTYLILLVVQAGQLRRNPDQARPIWSLRLWWQQIRYMLGLSRRWKAQQHTQQQLLGIAISRLGTLIILLGTAGSLEQELSGAEGAWYEAIWHILAGSSLMVFLSLLGGITLTAGLLAGLDYSVRLAFSKWIALIPETNADFLSESSADSSRVEDQAETLFLKALIEKSRKQN